MGSRPATSSDEPPARIRFAPRTGLRKSSVAPRRCMWRWFLTFLQPHFSGTALRCMSGRSHSPGRGPGLTESASALRTSDAGLLPESLCRMRCGRRVLDCCLTDSCRFLWHSGHSRGKSRSPGPMSEASSATRCRCVVLRPFDISHTSFLSTT